VREPGIRRLLLALALAASMWIYVQRVMVGHQLAEAAQRDIPRGNLSDLYPRWLGTRELLLRHRNPYSPQITREIQTGFYGRPLDPQKESDPRAQEAFVYPLWVVFLLAPSVTLPSAMLSTYFDGSWLAALVWAQCFGCTSWAFADGRCLCLQSSCWP